MSALRRTDLIPGPAGPPGRVVAVSAWTPGTIADRAWATIDVACTGAIVGLPAWAAWNVALTDGVHLFAKVNTADAVHVEMYNDSGAPVTIGAHTVTVEALTS